MIANAALAAAQTCLQAGTNNGNLWASEVGDGRTAKAKKRIRGIGYCIMKYEF